MISPASGSAGWLSARLARRELTALALVRDRLRRISEIDGALGAFVRLNPRAEDEARAADRRLDRGDGGPLTGIPLAIKDNIATAGIETSCASRALAGFVPLEDATVVARLRRAGAVILGKTNLDEFGMGSSTENSAHGPTRNPRDPSRVPGGSSGGSAVAVAAGMAPLALGSDTGGSVRQPASFCGTVGLKPTYGRVSRSGLVAFGSSLEQIGILAGTVGDAALLLEHLAGHDERDSTTAPRPVESYTAQCDGDVRGLRIGLPAEYLERGIDPEVAEGIDATARRLRRAGATVEPTDLPHTRYAVPTYYVLATAEASSNLARYDGVRYGVRVASGAGLQGMLRASRGAGFGAEVKRRIMLGTYALSAGYHAAFYDKAQRVRRHIRQDFLQRFADGFDLLLTPTTPTPAFRLGEKLDDPYAMYLSDIFTVTANLAGLPAISVPAGRTHDGLPIGAQLIAPDFAEGRLLRAASAIEIATATSPDGATPA